MKASITKTNFVRIIIHFSMVFRVVSFCVGRSFFHSNHHANTASVLPKKNTYTEVMVPSFNYSYVTRTRRRITMKRQSQHSLHLSLSRMSAIVENQSISKQSLLFLYKDTKCFGSKRSSNGILHHHPVDEQQPDHESSSSSTVPGSITIYNEQKTIPNINISKIEQTITIIRDIINYPTYDVNVILVDDDVMKETNFETRQINKPTDILSFPFHDTVLGGAKGAGLLQEPEFDIPDYYTLGDMMIDVPYVIRRCEEDKIFNERRSRLEYSESGIVEKEDEDEHHESQEYEIVEEEEEYEDYVGDDDRGVSGAMATIYDPEESILLLLVHGMLHLVGYDHIEDEDYEVMVAKEEEVLDLLKERLKKDSL